jgi:HEPN domain-containing protein
MPPKKIKSKTLEKGKYAVYVKKSEEFFETMLQAQKSGNWNAVGLNAVYCAISSADVLLVFFTGRRSTDESHQTVVNLLSMCENLPDLKVKAETLRRILVKKNLIAYEDKDFTQHDAIEIAKLAERFFRWVQSILPRG